MRTARSAVAEDGARAILLASGGLAALAPALRTQLGLEPIPDDLTLPPSGPGSVVRGGRAEGGGGRAGGAGGGGGGGLGGAAGAGGLGAGMMAAEAMDPPR